jgi:hypothetical protein
MKLDIRWPIGILFLTFGALIGGYGLLKPVPGAGSVVANINFLWGIVLAAFGGVMAILASVSGRRT